MGLKQKILASLKMSEETEQNNRFILVITVSGELAQRDKKDYFVFKMKIWCEEISQSWQIQYLGHQGILIFRDQRGTVADLTAFLSSLSEQRAKNKATKTLN